MEALPRNSGENSSRTTTKFSRAKGLLGFRPHPMSSTKKRMVEIKKGSSTDYIQAIREAVTHALEKPVLPAGHGSPGDKRQFQIKRVLTAEDSSRIIGSSFKRGISPVDLMAACTTMAIDQWNSARNIPRLFSPHPCQST